MTEEEKQALIAEGKLNPDGTPLNDGQEPDKTPDGGDDEVTYTKAQINQMIQERLKREREKQEEKLAAEKAEAERKRLEENQEFKSLADQYKAELDKAKEDARLAELNSKRTTLLVKAGYNEEQVLRYGKFVEGETDEELEAAVEQLKKDVPPTPAYVDPSANNSSRPKTPAKDKEEKGRSAYQRLKDAGRIRNR